MEDIKNPLETEENKTLSCSCEQIVHKRAFIQNTIMLLFFCESTLSISFFALEHKLVEISKLIGHCRENVSLKSALWLIACGQGPPGWSTAGSVRLPSL